MESRILSAAILTVASLYHQDTNYHQLLLDQFSLLVSSSVSSEKNGVGEILGLCIGSLWLPTVADILLDQALVIANTLEIHNQPEHAELWAFVYTCDQQYSYIRCTPQKVIYSGRPRGQSAGSVFVQASLYDLTPCNWDHRGTFEDISNFNLRLKDWTHQPPHLGHLGELEFHLVRFLVNSPIVRRLPISVNVEEREIKLGGTAVRSALWVFTMVLKNPKLLVGATSYVVHAIRIAIVCFGEIFHTHRGTWYSMLINEGGVLEKTLAVLELMESKLSAIDTKSTEFTQKVRPLFSQSSTDPLNQISDYLRSYRKSMF